MILGSYSVVYALWKYWEFIVEFNVSDILFLVSNFIQEMEKSAKKSKKSRKEEQKVEGDEDKSDYEDEVSILEITKDMEKVFGEIRKKIKGAKHIKSKDKLYHKVRNIYVLLSSNSRKFFERKIKRFNELSVISNDDLSTLTEIINEMIDKFIDEYPKFTSMSVSNELALRIEGREEWIKTGKEIAARFNVENLNLVQEEKKKWKEEDRFYRKSDEYINQIDKNGRNSLLYTWTLINNWA